MRSDIERWDRKFRGRQVDDKPEPDRLLLECPYLPSRGSALDIASGSGQNAVWLAERGLEVTAIDGSLEGMKLALALAARCGVRLRPIVADLDHYEPAGTFDLVVVMHYLNRRLFGSLTERLVPGGVLVVKTFNRDFLRRKPDFNPDFVLGPGELLEYFGRLDVLEHEESPTSGEGKSHIVCRKTRNQPPSSKGA